MMAQQADPRETAHGWTTNRPNESTLEDPTNTQDILDLVNESKQEENNEALSHVTSVPSSHYTESEVGKISTIKLSSYDYDRTTKKRRKSQMPEGELQLEEMELKSLVEAEKRTQEYLSMFTGLTGESLEKVMPLDEATKARLTLQRKKMLMNI